MQNNNILVSAIVSTYNSKKFIEGCLNDLVNQSIFNKMEIIIVDSGSQENEAAIVHKFQKKYDNLHYIRTPDRETIYASWNRAIKFAKGKYITNANTDDRHRKDALEILASELDKNELLDIVYADQFITNTPNQTFENATPVDRFNWPEFSKEILLEYCCIGPQPMWRRKLHSEKGFTFNESLHVAGDYDFWLRVTTEDNSKKINKILGLYYKSIDNTNKEFQNLYLTRIETYNVKKNAVANITANKNDDYLYSQIKHNTITIKNLLKNISKLDTRKIQHLFWLSSFYLYKLNKKSQAFNFAKEIFNIIKNPYLLAFHIKDISCENSSSKLHSEIKVSIIIPVYNSEDTIYETLNSIKNQSYTNYEIICVDDGSTDYSTSIIQKWAISNPKTDIKLITQQNSGTSSARNTAIKNSSSEYIIPLDADDCISNNYIEKTLLALINYNVDIVFTEAIFFGAKNKIWAKNDLSIPHIYSRNQLNATALFKKECWIRVGGFDENMSGYEDWEFWISLAKSGYKFYRIPEQLFFYRHTGSGRNNIANKNDVKNKIYIIQKHRDIYKNLENNDHHLLNTNQLIPHNLLIDRKKDFQIMNKILFVCHDFPPHKYAGAQLYAKHLAEKINSKNIYHAEIIFPVVRIKEKQDYEIISKKYENLLVHEFFKPCMDEPGKVFDKSVIESFNNFLKINHFDVIHFHGLGQLSLAPIFSASEHKIPSVITLHDYWFLCDRWHMIKHDQSLCSGPDTIEKCAACFLEARGMGNKQMDLAINYQTMRRSYMKKAFSLFAHRYAPSKFLANTFAKFGFSDIEIAPLGLPSLPQHPIRKITTNPTRIGYAGQFITRKGIDTLLDAFEIINDPTISLHIWGKPQDDPYGFEILKMIKDNPSIVYHGPFTSDNLEQIYSVIDLAIVPSRMENYPLTILEAYAHGTPVVATNVGGIPEIVANHSSDLLVEAGNSAQLAAAIRRALHPETYSSLCANIPQVRHIAQDAQDYIDRYNSILSKERPVQRAKILFYFFKNVHIPILLPLYHALKAQGADVEIGFSYLPPSPQIRAGLLPDEFRIIEQTGVPIHATPQEFNPDLTFIADSVYPWVEGCGKLVHVGHGVLSKGQYYTDTPTARREELADMVCVPGKHHQAIMRRIISKPVVATGMCKLDDLFSGKISRASVIKQFGLPDDYRYVLFAPTFNDELSAIPFVQDRIGQVLPDDKTLLIIKLHPSTKPEYKEMYRTLPNKDKRVIFADELDITPFLALCDVMISDVSSAMMEFAALNKPVILFNNPNWGSYQNYNPADIEFQWRDIGVQVSDLDEMRAAVSLCLQAPGLHADKRKKYTDLLFANKRGGNAAERIVKLALSLLEAEQNR